MWVTPSTEKSPDVSRNSYNQFHLKTTWIIIACVWNKKWVKTLNFWLWTLCCLFVSVCQLSLFCPFALFGIQRELSRLIPIISACTYFGLGSFKFWCSKNHVCNSKHMHSTIIQSEASSLMLACQHIELQIKTTASPATNTWSWTDEKLIFMWP